MNLEELTQNYDERLLGTYGPLHPRVRELFERFLRCGDLHFGFMRFYCDGCGENKYIPHSCSVRGLCPSCGQKRALLWAERLVEGEARAGGATNLPDTPYSQIVYTIPKMLRKAFLFRRDLYGELCRSPSCSSASPYASTREFLAAHYPGLHDPVPAMIAVPQSHGNLLQPHAHLHALCSLGVYDREGKFHPTPDDFVFPSGLALRTRLRASPHKPPASRVPGLLRAFAAAPARGSPSRGNLQREDIENAS